jgi:hypothetical protein
MLISSHGEWPTMISALLFRSPTSACLGCCTNPGYSLQDAFVRLGSAPGTGRFGDGIAS